MKEAHSCTVAIRIGMVSTAMRTYYTSVVDEGETTVQEDEAPSSVVFRSCECAAGAATGMLS